jgi:hypothetical protein
MFEQFRQTKAAAVAACGLSALALTSCGGSWEVSGIEVPKGSKELGTVGVGTDAAGVPQLARSFLVKSQLIQFVDCGSMTDPDGYVYEFQKQLTPINNKNTVVDCVYQTSGNLMTPSPEDVDKIMQVFRISP